MAPSLEARACHRPHTVGALVPDGSENQHEVYEGIIGLTSVIFEIIIIHKNTLTHAQHQPTVSAVLDWQRLLLLGGLAALDYTWVSRERIIVTRQTDRRQDREWSWPPKRKWQGTQSISVVQRRRDLEGRMGDHLMRACLLAPRSSTWSCGDFGLVTCFVDLWGQKSSICEIERLDIGEEKVLLYSLLWSEWSVKLRERPGMWHQGSPQLLQCLLLLNLQTQRLRVGRSAW
jgi:hypothetical protein